MKRRIVAYSAFSIYILTLIPIIILGFFNHPHGDDYHYGVGTHHVWITNRHFAPVIVEALKGTLEQYKIYQGTYSAMFLMHLPPNVFHANAYHFVTLVIVLLLSVGIFWLVGELIQGSLKLKGNIWLAIASVTAFLCIQTTIFTAESFFWYNGSMYYTGFFAVTLMIFALLIRAIRKEKLKYLTLLISGGLIIAGGNYISLLPSLIVVFLMVIFFIVKKRKKKAIICGCLFVSMFLGFLISALAPGNQIRQATAWKTPAVIAIFKSIKYGLGFIPAWLGGIMLLCLLTLTPFVWKELKTCEFRFPFPFFVIPGTYLVFCSAMCPSIYAQSTLGGMRCAALYYYGFVLVIVFAWFYLLGWLQRITEEQRKQRNKAFKCISIGMAVVLLAVSAVLMIRNNEFANLNMNRAMFSLCSGQAVQYEREYQERIVLLEDPAIRDVVCLPYSNPPELMYVGDYGEDPEGNRTIALFYDKDSFSVR